MLTTALLAPLGGLAATENSKPNIVVIVADDMGWGDAGTFGNELIQTPNMDLLPDAVAAVRALDDSSLVNSDGSPFVAKDFYPKFSWDTTPRYFMFGDKSRVLRPEQVRFIAEQTEFLCIEKSHGMGELGTAELGASPTLISSTVGGGRWEPVRWLTIPS